MEEPGPAVGALEAFVVFGAEDAHFAADIVGGEVGFEFLPDLFFPGHAGKEFQKPDEHPVTVDAGVPVETAIERRVIKPRFDGERTVGKSDAGFVGELALHAAEGQVGEVGGAGGGEVGLAGPNFILR